MTVFERIQTCSIEELARMIHGYSQTIASDINKQMAQAGVKIRQFTLSDDVEIALIIQLLNKKIN